MQAVLSRVLLIFTIVELPGFVIGIRLATLESLVVSDSYSNLQIPAGRRRRPGPAQRPGYSPPILPQAESGDFDGDSFKNDTGRDELLPSSPPILSFDVVPDSNDSTHDSEPLDGFSFSAAFAPGDHEPEPLKVDVNVQIQSIREIDELSEKLILEIDLTLHWKDYDFLPQEDSYHPPDLENITDLIRSYTSQPLPADAFAKLWKPDIIIERVVKITRPELLSSPFTVRAIPYTSSVIYTTRVLVKIDCSMDFQYYPSDSQHCYLNLRSYQNDNTKMKLQWNPLPGAYLVTTQSDDNFDVQLSQIGKKRKIVKDINLDDAAFTVLQMKLSMRRKMTYHLVQTYVPSSFLVFITWLSFLVPEELIEGRIGISMTTLLTLTAMFSAVRENTPIVSYVKAIDIWMVYCIFIVFTTLLEFTFFVWLRDYKCTQRRRKLQVLLEAEESRDRETAKNRSRLSMDEVKTKASETFEKSARLLNRFAFGFFVLNFVIFNLVYWPWLLVSSDHLTWDVNPLLNGNDDNDDSLLMDDI